MGHRVTGFGAFARDLADSRHDLDLRMDAEKSRALYQPDGEEAIGEQVSLISGRSRRCEAEAAADFDSAGAPARVLEGFRPPISSLSAAIICCFGR
jgi:hypothetical protein